MDVVEYAEPIAAKGLVFMDSPGFDPCSATGQVASGATMIAFTTGRGSAFGCKPSPSIKLSSNTEIYRRMEDDIDIDCGPIATGEASIEAEGRARSSTTCSRSPPAGAPRARRSATAAPSSCPGRSGR